MVKTTPLLDTVRVTAYTPTFTGFGTVTVQTFFYSLVAGFAFIQGKFTSGTATGVEARISLPPGCTSASTLPALSGVGLWTGYSAVSGSHMTVLVEPSVTYLTFGRQDSSTVGLAKRLGNGLLVAGDSISFTAIVPLA